MVVVVKMVMVMMMMKKMKVKIVCRKRWRRLLHQKRCVL